MIYDALIGESFNLCREYENLITGENEQDLEFLQRLYDLNFEIRKNGIKGLGEPEDEVMEDDVRIEFDRLVATLASLAEECRFPKVQLHMEEIRADLVSNGIDGIKPYK